MHEPSEILILKVIVAQSKVYNWRPDALVELLFWAEISTVRQTGAGDVMVLPWIPRGSRPGCDGCDMTNTPENRFCSPANTGQSPVSFSLSGSRLKEAAGTAELVTRDCRCGQITRITIASANTVEGEPSYLATGVVTALWDCECLNWTEAEWRGPRDWRILSVIIRGPSRDSDEQLIGQHGPTQLSILALFVTSLVPVCFWI